MGCIKDLIAHMGGEEAVQKGILNELRFFRIIKEGTHPPWLKSCREPSWRYDMFGVDAVIWITRPGSEEPIKVPIQIKSSHKGKLLFFARWQNCWFNNVIVVVVNESVTDEHILRYVHNRLLHIRMAGYDYKEFFAEISARKIPILIENRMKAFARVREKMKGGISS